MEYRSLSSHFASNKNLVEWTFRNTQKAIDFVNSNRVNDINHLDNVIMNVINKEDKEIAKRIVNDFNIEILEENV